MSTPHEVIFTAANSVYRDPKLSLDVANAVTDALRGEDIVPVCRHQLMAFAANCVHHGDMTPAGKSALERILEDHP